MPTPKNKKLYDEVKRLADDVYKKPSAYKSGYIVKKYKEMGGTYADDDKPKNLKRWFKEGWKDIGGLSYPVYRPTIKVNKNTPLTPSEISPSNLKQQIELKQKIKGAHNLPKFVAKDTYTISPYSYNQAEKLHVNIKPSTRRHKKIDVYDLSGKYICSIGDNRYNDMTTYLLVNKKLAEERRRLYKIRHSKDKDKVGSPGYYADKILW